MAFYAKNSLLSPNHVSSPYSRLDLRIGVPNSCLLIGKFVDVVFLLTTGCATICSLTITKSKAFLELGPNSTAMREHTLDDRIFHWNTA